MYIGAEQERQWEKAYGRPVCRSFRVEVRPEDLAMIRASQKHGRAHDITFLIAIGPSPERYVAIAKHGYPPGAYRIPSGGVHPGEDLEAGTEREASEETGLRVRIERYLLRATARFTCGDDALDWTTHVVLCGSLDEVPANGFTPTDTKEIREARLVTLDELQGPIRAALLASDRPLLGYRVALTDAVVEELRSMRPSGQL